MTFRRVFAPGGRKAESRKLKAEILLARAARISIFQLSASAASLAGSFTPLPPGTSVDLTLEGSDSGGDWAHWGYTSATSYDHKDGITPLISDYTVLGTNAPQQVINLGVDYTWTDGT